MDKGTSIGRVRGLGSAHAGAHHWVSDKVMSFASLILTVWFVVSLLMLPNLAHQTVVGWISGPVPATAMVLMVITGFWHAKGGMQIMIEDYVPDHAARFGVLAALNFVAIGTGAFALFCIFKLALGGA